MSAVHTFIHYDGVTYTCVPAKLTSYMDKEYNFWAEVTTDEGITYQSPVYNYNHDLGRSISEIMRSKQALSFSIVPKNLHFRTFDREIRRHREPYATRIFVDSKPVTILLDEMDEFCGVTSSGDFSEKEIVIFHTTQGATLDSKSLDKLSKYHKRNGSARVQWLQQERDRLMRDNETLPEKIFIDNIYYGTFKWRCESGHMELIREDGKNFCHIRFKDTVYKLVFELDNEKMDKIEKSFGPASKEGLLMDVYVLMDTETGIAQCISYDLDPDEFIFV